MEYKFSKKENEIEKAIVVESIKDLENLLERHAIDWRAWEKENNPNVKSINDLFNEIKSLDCDFIERNGELIRRIRVLGLKVYHESEGEKYVLTEDRQESSNGSIRRREKWSSVSEKIKMNENVGQELIKRALREELHISTGYTVKSIGTEINTQNNNLSFPGITSEYPIFKFEVFLNSEQFKIEGYTEEQEGLTTYFVWNKIN